MKKYANKVFTPVIILVLSIFTAIIFFSFHQASESKTSAAWIAHSHEVMFQTAQIMSVIEDNETGSRGYLLTGKPEFLEPLISSKKNIYPEIDTLRKLTSNNPLQQLRIDSIQFFTGKRFAFSDSTIALRNAKGLAATIPLVSTGEGKIYMDRIRQLVTEMKQEEERLLLERRIKNERDAVLLNRVIISIILIIVILLIIFVRKDYLQTVARKEVEESLKKNEAFLHLMTNNVKEYAIFMLDINGQVANWNRGATAVLGYDKEESLGKPYRIFFTQADIDNDEPRRNLALAEKYGQYETEGQRLKKNGELFWANVVMTVLKSETNEFSGFSVIVRDITEKKKTQEQVDFLSRQINYSSDAIYVVDAARKIKSWNRGAESLYGFTVKEVMDRDPNELLKTVITEAEITSALIKIEKQDYWTGELQRTTKGGKTIIVHSSSSAIRDAGGEITGYVAVSFDISDQIKLREQVNYLASVVEQSPEAIISTDTEQRIVSWNSGAETMYGFTKAETLGKTLTELGLTRLTGNDFPAVLKIVTEKGILKTETNQRHKNGIMFYGQITANIVKNEKDEIQSVVFMVSDISERKRLQEALQKSNEDLEIRVKERTEEVFKNEQRYRALIENSAEGIALLDENGLIFYRSPAAYRITGELPLGNALGFIHPDDVELIKLKGAEAVRKPAIPIDWQGRFKHANGEYAWMEGTFTNLLEVDGVNAIVANYRNISSRKQAEEKLVASEKQFRYTLDNMLEGVQIIGFDWKYIYVNEAMARHGRYPKEEFIGHTVMEKYPGIEDTQIFGVYKRCFENRESVHLENEFIYPDKSKAWFELSFQPVPEGIFILSVDITERKKAEERLIANEIRFRSLIENITDGIVLNDASFNILYQSPSVTKILGYSNEERAGKKVIDYIHPDDKEGFTNLYKRLDQSPGIPVSFQFKFFHKNGYYIWLEGVVTNLLNNSSVNAYVANYRDITQRKEAEEKLRQSETMYRNLFQHMLDGFCYCEADIRNGELVDFTYLHVNDEYEKLTGLRGVVGKKMSEINPDLLRHDNDYVNIITRVVQGGSPEKFETFVKPLGLWFSISIYSPKPGHFVNLVDNITVSKTIHQDLARSEKLYRSLFENMLNGFAYCKGHFEHGQLVDYTFLNVNEEFEIQTGLDGATGKKISAISPEILQSNQEYIDTLTNVALNGQSVKFETYNEPIKKWLAVAIYSPEKEYFVVLVDDITERKLVEERIKKNNADLERRVTKRTEQLKKSNEELEAFSYSVSHDLRAPLRAIIGFTAMLEDEYSNQLDSEAKRITGIIKDNTLKMGHLIDDLLAFSRMGRQDIIKTHIDTDTMIKEIIQLPEMREADKLNPIKWNVHELPNINADAITLRQVWINLISNAVKYSSKSEHPEIEINFYHEKGKMVFYVKDNGVGFDEKYKSKLFRVFQRLHSADEFEGTGIGLAIVEKIISKHDGSVWVEAVPGKGATFYFSIPEKEQKLMEKSFSN